MIPNRPALSSGESCYLNTSLEGQEENLQMDTRSRFNLHPAVCRVTNPRMVAVLGSAAICWQPAPVQLTGDCTREKDK